MSPFGFQLAACITVLLVHQTVAKDNWETKVNEKGKQVQSMQIQAPSMTEEDQYGYNMPDQYRCDSCKVVTYHLNEALRRKQPKNRRMSEWEYHELFDETCTAGFEGYGLSLVNGENMLSGPSIKRDNLEPGMGAIQMGGETWAKRLGEVCRKFVYERVGEDEVYDHFRSKGALSSDLCIRETRDCKVGAEPPRNEKKSKEATHEAKKSKVAKSGAKAEQIDVDTFIAQLAKKHGLNTVEYTKKRSFAKWEQMLSLATKRMTEKLQAQDEQVFEV